MDTLNKISKGLNKISRWFLILCFSVMSITFFAQVVLRYVFNTGLHWTEELTRYTNIAMVMVGSAILAGKNNHTNVSALEFFLSKEKRKILIFIQQLISIIFFGMSIFFGFRMMDLAGTQVSTNMRIPMKFVYGIFPVAFSILVFQIIVFLLNMIKADSSPGEEGGEG